MTLLYYGAPSSLPLACLPLRSLSLSLARAGQPTYPARYTPHRLHQLKPHGVGVLLAAHLHADRRAMVAPSWTIRQWQ